MEPLNSAGQDSSRLSSFCDDNVQEDSKTTDAKGQEATAIDIEGIISTLPKHQGWIEKFPLYQFQGFWYSSNILQSVIALAQEDSSKLFEFHPSDIIICSCMKTGTTWLKSLAFSIATRTRFSIDDSSAGHTLTQHETNSRNPLLKSVSHDLIPISLSKAFDLFSRGISPYWDHVLGYWKSSQDFPNRVLLMKYEDMIEDASFYVKRIADFMGYPFSKEGQSQGVVEKIGNLCIFENLSLGIIGQMNVFL